MNWGMLQQGMATYFAWLAVIVLIVASVFLILTLKRTIRRANKPVDILLRLYIQGKISKEEYLRMKKEVQR